MARGEAQPTEQGRAVAGGMGGWPLSQQRAVLLFIMQLESKQRVHNQRCVRLLHAAGTVTSQQQRRWHTWIALCTRDTSLDTADVTVREASSRALPF